MTKNTISTKRIFKLATEERGMFTFLCRVAGQVAHWSIHLENGKSFVSPESAMAFATDNGVRAGRPGGRLVICEDTGEGCFYPIGELRWVATK